MCRGNMGIFQNGFISWIFFPLAFCTFQLMKSKAEILRGNYYIILYFSSYLYALLYGNLHFTMNNYITYILEQMETVSKSWILTTSSTWVSFIFALFFNGGIKSDHSNKDIDKNSNWQKTQVRMAPSTVWMSFATMRTNMAYCFRYCCPRKALAVWIAMS